MKLQSFVKWAGSKRQLIPEIISYLPKRIDNYYEPFLGGGSLFWYLASNKLFKKAYLSDINKELINAWLSLQNHPRALIKDLKKHQFNNCKSYFYKIRKWDRTGVLNKKSITARGARMIYLNKTCFNGLWRVNSKDQNNVPYAYKKHVNLLQSGLLNDIDYLSNHKNNIHIECNDFREICSQIINNTSNSGYNNFVYFDPPYIPLNISSSFTDYNKYGFGLRDQEDVAKIVTELSIYGIKVMISNSDTSLTRKLYHSNLFHKHVVQARRMINSKGNGRGAVNELLITNY